MKFFLERCSGRLAWSTTVLGELTGTGPVGAMCKTEQLVRMGLIESTMSTAELIANVHAVMKILGTSATDEYEAFREVRDKLYIVTTKSTGISRILSHSVERTLIANAPEGAEGNLSVELEVAEAMAYRHRVFKAMARCGVISELARDDDDALAEEVRAMV